MGIPGKLYLVLADRGHYGWGVCSEYLFRELSCMTEVERLTPEHPDWNNPRLKGVTLHALAGELQTRSFARADKNCGYTFFEGRLSKEAVQAASCYDRIFVGSSWCQNLMEMAGLSQGKVLIQGIDHEIFSPMEDDANATRSPFVVFSGSKLEYRKGQDLTLAAMKIIQERYRDVHLITLWDNYLENSLDSMRRSSHIRFELEGDDWPKKVAHLCDINGLDPERVFSLEHIKHQDCAEVYRNADLGIFPSRCESGTNLVLMEYMACGKPAIVSATGGHLDVANARNALMLTRLKDVHIDEYYGKSFDGPWQEASVEELVEAIDFAYHHREETRVLGQAALRDMRAFSWRQTAETLLSEIELLWKD